MGLIFERTDMIGLLLLYFAVFYSGVLVVRRLALQRLSHRLVVIFSVGAAQLMLAIQAVSLFRCLRPPVLLGANLAITGLVFAVTRWKRPSASFRSYRELVSELVARFKIEKLGLLPWFLLGICLASITGRCLVGSFVIPLSDVYHFEMPLYWVQNHSIAPFVVNNPRITAVSFLGEALAMPGYLYLHSGVMFVILSLFAATATVALVFSLGNRLGCSSGASICAAALVAGYTDFITAALQLTLGSYLTSMWAAASLLFLLDSRPLGGRPGCRTALALSLVCFLMACGSKNSLSLSAPFYLLAVGIVHGRALFAKQTFAALSLAGVLGLVCSGAAWNYVSNKIWFGNLGGPKFLQEFASQEHNPRAIWTRLCRGSVLLGMDILYLPSSLHPAYVKVAEAAVSVLGGQKQLREDDEYFSFGPKAIAPRRGAGLVGIAFLLPGLGVALWRVARAVRGRRLRDAETAAIVLVLLLIGMFFTCHVFFRWQWIGLLRLIPAFAIIGAPFAGFLLERRSLQLLALLLLLASTAVLLFFDLSLAGRRLAWVGQKPAFAWIYRFTNDHTQVVQCKARDRELRQLVIREDYTRREVIQTFLQSVHAPSVIAFAGDENFESYYLFGDHFQNRVVSLADCRNPGKLNQPQPGTDYLVISDCDDRLKDWAGLFGFTPVFEAFAGEKRLLAAFEREARAADDSRTFAPRPFRPFHGLANNGLAVDAKFSSN